MAEKEVSFKISANITDSIESIGKLSDKINNLGDSEGLKDLLENLKGVGLVLGTLGAAAFAFKTSIDLVEEAEQIKQTENQFNELTAAANISATTLKEGLEKSAAGLISNNDLLEIANKAIVKMGQSAQKLPQILELARKATQVFGGDVKQNFEAMTNAIANGNVRLLRQYGLNIDAKKAVEDFAKAQGIAVNTISDAGRRQAILNAALSQGQERFKGISGDLEKTTSIMQSIKVSISEIGEIFTLIFDKTIGPTLKKFLNGVKEDLSSLKTYFQATFGEGLEKTNAQIKYTQSTIDQMRVQIEKLNALKASNSPLFTPADQTSLDFYSKKIVLLTSELEKLKQKNKEFHTEELQSENQKRSGSKGGSSDNSIINAEEKKKNEEKLQKDLYDIHKKYLDLKAQSVQSFEEIEESIRNNKVLLEEEYTRKLEEISQRKDLNESQKMQEKEKLSQMHQLELQRQEQETAAVRTKLLDNYVKNSQNAAQGIGRAFSAQAKKSQQELVDFGATGQRVMQSFQRHSTYAFETMGAEIAKGANVAQSVANAMKNIILNVIADECIARGSMMVLAGIFPPNPLVIGGGVGLIALGGALRSIAGGTGSVPAGGGGGGLGAGSSGIDTPTSGSTNDQSAVSQNVLPQKTVSVNIQGNLFNTSETQRSLMEMIRQETDATGFEYNKVGA